jgi:hypothetical protein
MIDETEPELPKRYSTSSCNIYIVWCILSAVSIVNLAFLKENVVLLAENPILICKVWTVISMK